MLDKNMEFTGFVEALGSNGEGIVKSEGTILFRALYADGRKSETESLKVKNKIRLRKSFGSFYARGRARASRMQELYALRRLSVTAREIYFATQTQTENRPRRACKDRGHR